MIVCALHMHSPLPWISSLERRTPVRHSTCDDRCDDLNVSDTARTIASATLAVNLKAELGREGLDLVTDDLHSRCAAATSTIPIWWSVNADYQHGARGEK